MKSSMSTFRTSLLLLTLFGSLCQSVSLFVQNYTQQQGKEKKGAVLQPLLASQTAQELLSSSIAALLVKAILTSWHAVQVKKNFETMLLAPINSLLYVRVCTDWIRLPSFLTYRPVAKGDADVI